MPAQQRDEVAGDREEDDHDKNGDDDSCGSAREHTQGAGDGESGDGAERGVLVMERPPEEVDGQGHPQRGEKLRIDQVREEEEPDRGEEDERGIESGDGVKEQPRSKREGQQEQGKRIEGQRETSRPVGYSEELE